MPFDLAAGFGWQLKIHIVRKQREDVFATLRMVSHAEKIRRPEFLTSVRLNGRVYHGFDGGDVRQSVVDQTRLDRPQDTGLMLRV